MAKTKKEAGVVEIETNNSSVKKVKEPKIHLQKYLNNDRGFSAGQIAILKVVFKRKMYTEKDWEKKIEAEFARTYH